MLIEGASTARQIARPLNRHFTVHWERAGIADDRAAKATTAFLKYWREWLGGETAYLWTRENGEGKGSHVHILAHLPPGRRLHGARAMQWIARLSGKPYRPGAILTRRIKGAVAPNEPLYAANLARVLGYAMKGAEPGAAAALAIKRQPGGRIIGKRWRDQSQHRIRSTLCKSGGGFGGKSRWSRMSDFGVESRQLRSRTRGRFRAS